MRREGRFPWSKKGVRGPMDGCGVMHQERIAGLILAAGRSSRMGGFKPLLDLGGRTVLETLVETYRAAGLRDLLVVLGHRADEVEPLLAARSVPWVVNDRPDRGMFSSIQTGVRCLPADCSAFFLQPADIPLIRPETLKSLWSAWRETPAMIVYPCHGGRRGHPPLISTSLIPAIGAFDGTGGMRAFLSPHRDNAVHVDVDDPGIHIDLDTPDAYAAIKKGESP